MNQLPQIYLIRHGETAWSLTGQHTGSTEIELTERGQEQALGLGERLEKIEFSHVLVSPRLRARQTCDLAGLASASETEAKLAEWNYGSYEGLRTVDIRKERPNWTRLAGRLPGRRIAGADVGPRGPADHPPVLDARQGGPVRARPSGRRAGRPLDRPAHRRGRHFVLHPASLSILGHSPDHTARRLIELWNETALAQH